MLDFKYLQKEDPEIYDAIMKEKKRQQDNLEMIASENFTSEAVMEAMGSYMTNKYAEGYPNARYYAGCQNVDISENLARERLKKLFGAEHANVQPHSGAQANEAVYVACLKKGDTVLSMTLNSGGHISHMSKATAQSRFYNSVQYDVNPETYEIDYDEVERLAIENKPKLIICGASAYPRIIDFKRFREIADKVGSLLMVDMAHIAGLVAAGLHPSPVPYADFVTSTTHKTLRGPRGGIILCKEEWAKKIDLAVFPRTQGGPLEHIIAAKAVAFKEALSPEFKEYQKQIVANAKTLAEQLIKNGFNVLTGGTDNHLVLLDLRNKGITGAELEQRLDSVRITTNKNAVPFDTEDKKTTSGLRLGTPALTTRGMKESEMIEIANLIGKCAESEENFNKNKKDIIASVDKLTKKFPLYND
jgi:glycine hydroxymethyltransferase